MISLPVGLALVALCVAALVARRRRAAAFEVAGPDLAPRVMATIADEEPEWGPTPLASIRDIALREDQLRAMQANVRRASTIAEQHAAAGILEVPGERHGVVRPGERGWGR